MKINDKVSTVRPGKISSDWSPEALLTRRWGVTGVIVSAHDSHGECYGVKHDDDGSIGYYEPRELRLRTCATVQITEDRAKILLLQHGLAGHEGFPQDKDLVGQLIRKFPHLERDNYFGADFTS